jgi:2-polyprenyl-3-methyl-5-hydroxy-6-metoxy-1,4-benzoquinol methylase
MGSTRTVTAGEQPSPELFFRTANAHQETAILRCAIELDVFTAIGEGNSTTAAIARSRGVSERGTRMLCDALATLGFITKNGTEYALTADTAAFLDRRSRTYIGGSVAFLNSPMLISAFDNLAAAVRKGGTTMAGHGSMEPDNPVWVEFARAMAPLMQPMAEWIAGVVASEPLPGPRVRVLDIAAGHGLFGISIANSIPNSDIVAVDWASVLEEAKKNASLFGVADRYRTIPGDAFTVDFGGGYDVALLTNFLHHFDPPTNVGLLKKVRAALKPGGRAITLEFVPDSNRTSPPWSALFPLTMLATTESGDAYTFTEYERMHSEAGYRSTELMSHPTLVPRLIVGTT